MARLRLLCLALLAALAPCIEHARAQNAQPDARLLQPALDGNPREIPGFRRPPPPRSTAAPSRIGQSFTHVPAAGAGTTGFVSTNARRRAEQTASPKGATKGATKGAASGRSGIVRVIARPAPPVLNAPQGRPPPAARRGASLTDPAAIAAATGTLAVAPQRRSRAPVEEDPFAPAGIRAGSFVLRPAIEFLGGHDTNPARLATPRGAASLRVAPELALRSEWLRHELKADLRGGYIAYDRDFTPSLNRPNIDAKVNGRIDASTRTRIDLEGRYALGTENPGSPNLPADLARIPIYNRAGTTVGIAHRFNRFEIGMAGTLERTAYQDSRLIDGSSASNEARNYNQYGAQLRGSYELMPGIKPFMAIEADTRRHDLEVDSAGFRRDSTGITPKLGTSFELSRLLTGEISAGYLTRSYQDAALQDLRGAVADASLVWLASGLTKVTLTAKSVAEESTQSGVSGALKRDVGLQVDHALRRWLVGTLKLGYGFDEYVGSTREDSRTFVSAGLTYKLTRTVQIKGELRHDWLRSSVAGADYNATAILFGLRLQR